jgi:hypothetical protein
LSLLSLHDHGKNSYPFSLCVLSPVFKAYFWHIFHLALNLTLISGLTAHHVEAAPHPTTSKLIGSVVVDAKAGGQWLRDEGDDVPRQSQSLGMIWGVKPSLDYAINHFIWVGGELGISWLHEPVRRIATSASQQNSYSGGQRVIFTPAIRGRLDFPIDCRWIFEGTFNAGLTMWGVTRNASPEAYDEGRWGLSWQMQFGVRYVINTQVHFVVGGGYAEQQVYTDEGSINLSSFPIVLGLRGGF